MMAKLTECPIAKLVFDAQLWPRVERDDRRVATLVDVLVAGGQLPPVKVQRGSGVVLGGWHTVAAYRELRRETVPVETVDIPNNECLLYAYREDATSALPYTVADVRSVARRLYQERSNGCSANVADIARDLGRSRRTVASWVDDLVAKKEVEVELKRAARVVACHAFRNSGLSTRRVAELVGVSQGQVNSDGKIAIAIHFTDAAIVSEAHQVIHKALELGATVAEMQAARDWLIGQTNPDDLKQRECKARAGALQYALDDEGEASAWMDH